MHTIKILLLLLISLPTFFAYAEQCAELFDYKMQKLRSSETLDFCENLPGKVVLVVNTASKCGFTPQFTGLEALNKKFQEQGLIVIGFPSGDFGQELDDPEKTAEVCYINYGVTFPMMTKSAVTGDDANDFYKRLAKRTGKTPQWNFYKYLISRDGETITAYANTVTPADLENTISTLLSEPAKDTM